MKNRMLLLILSCSMVVAMLLASCTPAATTTEKPATTTEKPATTTEKPAPTTEKPAPVTEEPRYGGVFRQTWDSAPTRFDEVTGHIAQAQTLFLSHEELVIGDWAKGPAGTGEITWTNNLGPPMDLLRGALAESWEIIDQQTIIFHIRKGVHFHNKPPTNGREMTADDVYFSFKRVWESPKSYQSSSAPYEKTVESMTVPDKWTVVLKAQPGKLGAVFGTVTNTRIMPRDAAEMYGDLNDWHNSIGTGAWILENYVEQSSATLVRNPNYWMTDPVHPGNQLPYMDGVVALIIPDRSTQLAAMRTGKLDYIGHGHAGGPLSWEDANSLMKTNPELKYTSFPLGRSTGLFMRVDKPDLPFYDKKVRHALMMAINHKELLDTFYGGQGNILSWPAAPMPEFKDYYTPLEQLPRSTQELFEYHPDKAKQLLAEAGYPDGFKTSILLTSGSADLVSVVKAYWEKIDVDLELQVRESGVYYSMLVGKTYTDMILMTLAGFIPTAHVFDKPGQTYNLSQVDDPHINEVMEKVQELWLVDEEERNQLMKEIIPYKLDLCYVIQLIGPDVYRFWQPWVMGYHGESNMGSNHYCEFQQYIWLDQDLREKMTGKR